MSAFVQGRATLHIHSRASLARLYRLRLLALLPVLLAGILNTGYQLLLARGISEPGNAATIDLANATPSLFDAFVAGVLQVGPVLLAAMITVGLWERIFAHARQRAFDSGAFVIAIVFTMLAHPGTALLHVGFALSFAMVFGRCVFGGEGKTFVNPALLGIAVLQISYPSALADHPLWTAMSGYAGTRAIDLFTQAGAAGLSQAGIDWWSAFLGTTQGAIGTTSVLAVLGGAVVMVLSRIASWQLMVALVLGVIAGSLAMTWLVEDVVVPPWYWQLVLGSLAFGIVYVATDPSSACATSTGRWVQGVLMGFLIVMIRLLNSSHLDGVVPVLLLGSMLAPLIDYLVTWRNIRQRGARHG